MILSRNLIIFKQIARNFSSEYIISSKAKDIRLPKIGLHEYLWQNLNKWGDKTAIVCFETQRSYTYHQLYKRSLSVSNFLRKSLAFKTRDTVAIILHNVPEYPIIFLGATQAGFRVTTFNPSYTADEIKRQLDNSQSRLVFTSRELLPLVRQATNLPIVEISNDNSVSNGTISFNEISTGETYSPKGVSFDDIAVLPYSSGTTGLPKGVQLSHFNLVANLCQITAPEFVLVQEAVGNDQDVVPGILPFFHIYGLVIVLLQGLTFGAKIITMPKFSTDNFVKLLKNYKSDVLYVVPLVVIMANNNPNIKKEDLLGIRYIMSGAAPLGASDVERFQEKTDGKVCVIQGYGMTETSPVTLTQTKKLEHGLKTGGSGFLTPNTYAKIIPVKEEPSNQTLAANEVGELVVKGPQNMVGYYNNDKANQEIFLGDGWLRTGDIGYYDEYDHFYVVDRCKELIKVKGFQVAPAELEEIIRTHPGVEDVGVVGITHPILGEAPKAFVVPKANQSVKTKEIEDYVANKVSKHKHLAGGVTLVDAIPKSASGKILRRELRKL